jgi:hypothetical protein
LTHSGIQSLLHSKNVLAALIALFAILSLLAAATAYLLVFGVPGRGCSLASARVPAAVKTSPEMIARQLFDQYLESCMEPLADGRKRLDEYQIDTISIIRYHGSGFVFSVVFSVKPASSFTDWIAGNGLSRPDGWIERKFLFVDVVQIGGDYRIQSIGTGP